MDFLAFILMVALGASIYYYFKKKLSYFKDRGVPYEPGLPLLGNMASVIFGINSMMSMVRDIYKAHPDAKYVGAFSFGQPVIILRDPELIKMIGVKHFDNFQDHAFTMEKESEPLIGHNLFHLKGECWRATRSILSPAFTSSKMKSMFHLMVECGKNFKTYVSQLSNDERKEVSTKDLFTKYTADVIARCAFGLEVDSLKDPTNDFYFFGKKGVIFDTFKYFKFYIVTTLPKIMKLFNVKIIDKDVALFFKRAVADIIEIRHREGIRRQDMIQLLMDAQNSEKKSLKFNIDAITAHALAFFIGGFDTTSTQLCIMAHELAINPDVQKKLQNEIDQIIKETNGEVTYEAMQKMTYFDAIFRESLRRHVELIIIDRICENPFELPPALPGSKPFTIEAGMKIWISSKAIHMDSKYYENPDKFDPQRYYQKKITINDELNLGFGIGPRSCIAFRFAILKTKVLFFHLLSEFNLIANERTNAVVKYCKDLADVKQAGGFGLAIERRNKVISVC